MSSGSCFLIFEALVSTTEFEVDIVVWDMMLVAASLRFIFETIA